MQYIAIDLKSFYASVECVERGLDPLATNLVVADESRTEKTICPAVSPALKSFGIPGRPRLFEVIQLIDEANRQRKYKAPNRTFTGKSHNLTELNSNPALEIDYIVAPPQMAHYMKVSTDIYQIYLKYIAPEDIHVYSIDEVFMDVTAYLKTYKMTAHELAITMIKDVLANTGITATAGIGTNMYLAKVAMDIVAKKMPADKDGVRIAELDEMSYRRQLWAHRPITDFWRVGKGYAKKLADKYIFTMGDVAELSLRNEDLLYKMFGINAELLIDHAWGWEPCTIADIKAFKPQSNSLSSGQVLQHPYDFEKGRLIVREMTDLLVLDLVEKGLVTDQMVLTVGYDKLGAENYDGEYTSDHYGRRIPKSAHGSINLGRQTSSSKIIMDKVTELYNRIVDSRLYVRRMYIVANHVVSESSVAEENSEQLSLFAYSEEEMQKKEQENRSLEREKSMQKALVSIKRKYGKNAILKGMNLEDGATSVERNNQVGGHKA
ncbi:MAG: DNA methylase [Oscillospiraceae bacterium]|nr:DNA methylase [Oscillospiraceae bacterium]